MAINVVCPACQASYSLRDDMAGKKVRCKSCGGVIVVGATPAAAPASGPAKSPASSAAKNDLDFRDEPSPRAGAVASSPPKSMYLTNPVKEDRTPQSGPPRKLIAWCVIIGVPLLVLGVWWVWSAIHAGQMGKRPGIAVVVRAPQTFSPGNVEELVKSELTKALEEHGWGVRDDGAYKADVYVTFSSKQRYANKAKNSFLELEYPKCEIKIMDGAKEIANVKAHGGLKSVVPDQIFTAGLEMSGYKDMMERIRSGEFALPTPPAR